MAIQADSILADFILIGNPEFGPLLLARACQNNMAVKQMLEMAFYHPVIEEGACTARRDAEEKLLYGLPKIEHCTDYTPGT